MPEDPTLGELARADDRTERALERLTTALNNVSEKLDRLPDSIDKTYVRKDVAQERDGRVTSALAELAGDIKQTREENREQFEKYSVWGRWLVAAVLVPTILEIFSILSAHGGFG